MAGARGRISDAEIRSRLLARNLWQYGNAAAADLLAQKKNAVHALAWTDPAVVSRAHGARDRRASVDPVSF